MWSAWPGGAFRSRSTRTRCSGPAWTRRQPLRGERSDFHLSILRASLSEATGDGVADVRRARFKCAVEKPMIQTWRASVAGPRQLAMDSVRSSASLELAGGGIGGVLRPRVERDHREWCCLVDDVDHRLEQREAFRRNSQTTADHHAVVGGTLQRFFEHGAPG